MATHFVPTEEIQKLTTGSYEHLASQIDEAISRDARKVFGESVPNRIERIGTFGDYVLVAADDGRFAKVQYAKDSKTGHIKVVTAEAISVPLYTEANLNTYLMKEASAIVESLLAHDEGQAGSRLTALLPFIEETLPFDENQFVASMLESWEADRPWKHIYAERTDQIHEFLGPTHQEVESRKLTSKFESLLSGVEASKLEDFRQVALTDLAFLTESMGSWLKLTEGAAALSGSQELVSEEDKPVLTTFLAFAEDLKRDLQDVQESVAEAVKQVQSVANLGKLYDVLAEKCFHFEVASRFASAMIAGLHQPE